MFLVSDYIYSDNSQHLIEEIHVAVLVIFGKYVMSYLRYELF